VHVLAHLDEKDGKARVLAEGRLFVPGDAGVLLELPEDLPGHGGFIRLDGPVEGRQDVLAEIAVGIDEEVTHGLNDLLGPYFSHPLPLHSSPQAPLVGILAAE